MDRDRDGTSVTHLQQMGSEGEEALLVHGRLGVRRASPLWNLKISKNYLLSPKQNVFLKFWALVQLKTQEMLKQTNGAASESQGFRLEDAEMKRFRFSQSDKTDPTHTVIFL